MKRMKERDRETVRSMVADIKRYGRVSIKNYPGLTKHMFYTRRAYAGLVIDLVPDAGEEVEKLRKELEKANAEIKRIETLVTVITGSYQAGRDNTEDLIDEISRRDEETGMLSKQNGELSQKTYALLQENGKLSQQVESLKRENSVLLNSRNSLREYIDSVEDRVHMLLWDLRDFEKGYLPNDIQTFSDELRKNVIEKTQQIHDLRKTLDPEYRGPK